MGHDGVARARGRPEVRQLRHEGHGLALARRGQALRLRRAQLGLTPRHPVASVRALQKTRNAKKTASATHSSQIVTTTTAATRLTGFSPSSTSLAFWRHSANTSGGIIFAARRTPTGTTTISSSSPTTGMKSGIGSMGLKTWPTMRAAKTFAYQGVLGWR